MLWTLESAVLALWGQKPAAQGNNKCVPVQENTLTQAICLQLIGKEMNISELRFEEETLPASSPSSAALLAIQTPQGPCDPKCPKVSQVVIDSGAAILESNAPRHTAACCSVLVLYFKWWGVPGDTARLGFVLPLEERTQKACSIFVMFALFPNIDVGAFGWSLVACAPASSKCSITCGKPPWQSPVHALLAQLHQSRKVG